jgi:hypothetical protein
MSGYADFTQLGGLNCFQDTLEFMQNSYIKPADALSAFVGDKYVLTGCEEIAGNVTDGWIVVNGQAIEFFGGPITSTSKVVVNTVVIDESYDDATLKPFYYLKTASIGVIGGFDYTELKRLPFKANGVADACTQMSILLKAIIQFEPEVIISGLEVSNVNTGSGTMELSSGLVLFDGKIVTPAAYTGSFPVWLNETGNWINTQPVSGLFIKFDPHTSQRYKNVLDRAITPVGRVIMEETLSDRFDTVTGLGKWEMKGYQLMNAMQGRVPVGLWFDGISQSNVTDSAYQTLPAQGGVKNHVVSKQNIQEFTISKPGSSGTGGVGNPVAGDQSNDGSVDYKVGVTNPTPIDHRQPWNLLVFAKRI